MNEDHICSLYPDLYAFMYTNRRFLAMALFYRHEVANFPSSALALERALNAFTVCSFTLISALFDPTLSSSSQCIFRMEFTSLFRYIHLVRFCFLNFKLHEAILVLWSEPFILKKILR